METICWEAHTSDLTSSVAKLYHNVEFIDCVLDTDGGLVNAHRVILAACSPYFKNLLVDYDSMVPIPLKEIKYSDMKCLLDFIYNGEVNVRIVDVSSFMRNVKFLQVASLTRFYSNFTDNVSCNNGSEIQLSCSSTLSGVNNLSHEGEDFTEKGSPGVYEEVDGLSASTESTEFQSICIAVSESVDVSKQLSELKNDSDRGASSFKSQIIKKEIVDEDGENFQDHLNPISFVAVSPFSEDVEGHDDKSVRCSDTELKNPLEEYSFDCDLTKERIVKRENDLKTEPTMQMSYEEEMYVCKVPFPNMDDMSIYRTLKNNTDNIPFDGNVKVLCDVLSANIDGKSLVVCEPTIDIQINQNVSLVKKVCEDCSKDGFVERPSNLEVKFEAICDISEHDIKEEKLCESLTCNHTQESNNDPFIVLEQREKQLPDDSTIVDVRKEMSDVLASLTQTRMKLSEERIVSQNINSIQVQGCNENSAIDETRGSAITQIKLCEEREELRDTTKEERTGRNSSDFAKFKTQKQCKIQHSVQGDSFHLDSSDLRDAPGLFWKEDSLFTKGRKYSSSNSRKSFFQVSHLRVLMQTHAGDKLSQCKICAKSFREKFCLISHMQIHHGKKLFRCEINKYLSLSKTYLTKHLRRNIWMKLFQCIICGKSFSVGGTLKQHMRTHFRVKHYQCYICRKSFTQKRYISMHMQTHTENKLLACELCEKSFSCNDNFKSHKQRHTGENVCQFEICNKSFSQTSYLTRRIHTGLKSLQCVICEKLYSEGGSLNEHMRTHTGEKPSKCEFCKNSFKQGGTLKNHMRTHTGEKPYQCKICRKSFSKGCSLKRHMRTHTGEKPFQCEVCKKFFSRKTNLSTHMNIHTGLKQHKCAVCEKSFSEGGSLKKHMRTHTGEKPYQCEICEKLFSDGSTLKKHMRIHTGERPYQCEICEKSFSDGSTLKKHMRTHTGEKPYQCRICEKSFSDGSTLKKHMRIHTGEKPYLCEICEKSFSEGGSLKRHMRTHTV